MRFLIRGRIADGDIPRHMAVNETRIDAPALVGKGATPLSSLRRQESREMIISALPNRSNC